MNPIFQKTIDGCYSACIASLLGLEAESVPHFTQYDEAQEYCLTQGFCLVYLPWPVHERIYNTKFKAILVGRIAGQDTEWGHAVIVQHGRIIHDPEPSPARFDGPPEAYLALVPIDPAKQPGRADL